MKKLIANFDWSLPVVSLVILLLGLAIMASIAPNSLNQQLFSAILGLLLFFVFSQLDYQIFSKTSWLFFLGCLLFLATPLVFGTITRGSLRWIQLGKMTLQPSELVKPFLILIFADFFNQPRQFGWRQILKGALFLILPLLLIFFQPDLGSSLVVFGSWLGVVLAAGVGGWWFLAGGAAATVFLPLAWRFLQPYQKERILSFLNTSEDPLGASYHLIQARVAVGAGQLLGRGWGRGTQSHLQFLPERYTDFIFASFAEEFGFLGSFVLVLLFAFLLYRLIIIAQKAQDNFGFLICLGIFSLIFVQFFINIGINLALLPITGITLPLVSYGGSSLLATMICLGIAENIARQGQLQKIIEIK